MEISNTSNVISQITRLTPLADDRIQRESITYIDSNGSVRLNVVTELYNKFGQTYQYSDPQVNFLV